MKLRGTLFLEARFEKVVDVVQRSRRHNAEDCVAALHFDTRVHVVAQQAPEFVSILEGAVLDQWRRRT